MNPEVTNIIVPTTKTVIRKPRKKKNPQLTIVGSEGPGTAGKRTTSSADLRDFKWTAEKESFEPGMLATWQPNSPNHPKGVVLLYRNHNVIEQVIQRTCSKYAPHQEEIVEETIKQAYGEIIVAKVAHSEYAKSLVPDAKIVDETMRSQADLTMSLLGLMSEDALIPRRLSGILTQTRNTQNK